MTGKKIIDLELVMEGRVGENWKLSVQKIKPSTFYRLGRMTNQREKILFLLEYKNLKGGELPVPGQNSGGGRQDVALKAASCRQGA